MSREERLQSIYDENGRPGAAAFRFSVRRAGLEISEAEAKAFVARQSVGQVFQGRIPSDGKVPGGGREDQRWQMDLIDFSKRIAKLNNQRNVYNRQAFTQSMPNKTASVTLDAFRKIIRRNGGVMPREVTLDMGNEYALLEKEINDGGGVIRRKKPTASNQHFKCD